MAARQQKKGGGRRRNDKEHFKEDMEDMGVSWKVTRGFASERHIY